MTSVTQPRLHHLALTVRPRLGKRRQQSRKSRKAVAIGRREIRAAIKRRAVRREKHGHGPATVARERLHGLHIDVIDVGPLLAVDLHVDEVPIHQRRRIAVLERLALHHVTPVTRRVADR